MGLNKRKNDSQDCNIENVGKERKIIRKKKHNFSFIHSKMLFICDIIPPFLHISTHSAFSSSHFVIFFLSSPSFLLSLFVFVCLFLLKYAAILIDF